MRWCVETHPTDQTRASPQISDSVDWFEKAWEDREERVYPELFGATGDGIFALSGEVFTETFSQPSWDPRWLTYGVFQSVPNSKHRSWLYVTSGLSNAWNVESPDPNGVSGLGCEFVFETTTGGNWAILRVQHVLAFQILIAHGRYPNSELLDFYDRIPLRSSITPEPSELTYLMVAPASGYVSSFNLESGSVDLLALVGITEAEAQFARENSGQELLTRLSEFGAFPITDPTRRCTINR